MRWALLLLVLVFFAPCSFGQSEHLVIDQVRPQSVTIGSDTLTGIAHLEIIKPLRILPCRFMTIVFVIVEQEYKPIKKSTLRKMLRSISTVPGSD